MILKELHINNFRSFIKGKVLLNPVTALVGPNGGGKSNVLHALDYFYTQNYQLEDIDFHDRDTSTTLSVTLVFSCLNAAEHERFGPYLDDNDLAITKETVWNNGTPISKYYGSRMQCLDFTNIRAQTGMTDRKNLYNELVDAGSHEGLAKVTKGADVEAKLADWERLHPGKCVRRRDDGQIWGFTGVGFGRIDQFSKWIFVPAVKEASTEGVEGKGNALKNLLDILLRPKLEHHPELLTLRAEVTKKYHELLDPGNLTELKDLSSALTESLKQFAPDTCVEIGWQNLEDVKLPTPLSSTNVGEGNFIGPLDRCGHGTQRAFLIAILNHLVKVRLVNAEDKTADSPHIILGIEEPELYLHPIRSRLMYQMLHKLSIQSTSGLAIQSVYATHSPHFVTVENFKEVRIIRRTPSTISGKPHTSEVYRADMDKVASELAVAHEKKKEEFSEGRLMPRLANVMTTGTNEGFFADHVVLVEGEEDRAYLLGCAAANGQDLEAHGIPVISVGGKTNLDRPFVIFRAFGIKSFLVFDGDADKKGDASKSKPEINKALLRLTGETAADFPGTKCWANGACFLNTLKSTVEQELGGEFNEILAAVSAEFGYEEPSRAEKNPKVINEVLYRCREKGKESRSLKNILEHIVPEH